LDDRRRDGVTKSTLKTKEQGMHLNFNEHDDDDIALFYLTTIGRHFLPDR